MRGRTEIVLRLQGAGVEAFIFGMFHHPAMGQDEIPGARALREEILCLPVHQDLGDAELDRLAAVLAPLLAPARTGGG